MQQKKEQGGLAASFDSLVRRCGRKGERGISIFEISILFKMRRSVMYLK